MTKMDSEIVFSEIDGVDWDYALYKMKSEKLLFEAAKDFYQLNEAEAMTLERFLERFLSGDQMVLSEYRIKVHSMKSSAALIGAMSVSALARVLEYAAKEEQIPVIRCVTPFFIDEWRGLKKKMQKMFLEKGKEKKAPDYFLLLEYLKLLKSAIADMDIDTSDEIIRQMQVFQYDGETGKRVEELSLAVAEIDAGHTIAIADELEELFMQDS